MTTRSRNSVLAQVASDAAADLDLPHIIHVKDRFLDVPLVFGPFDGPVVASTVAEAYLEGVVYEGCETPPIVTILPLRHG